MRIDHINDQNIVILGAGSGIGEALCEHLGSNNNVVGISRDATKINSSLVKAIQGDLSNALSLENSLDEAIMHLGQVDTFVITAGSCIVAGFSEFKSEDVVNIIETNIYGTTFAIQKMLNHMLGKKSGTIICTSSISGQEDLPLCSLYGASKAYLDKMISVIYQEIKNTKVRIMGVSPGTVDTPFLDKINYYDKNIAEFAVSKNRIPVDVIANLYMMLMTDTGKYFNGKVIPVGTYE